MKYKQCSKCGTKNDSMFFICKKCGAQLPDTVYDENADANEAAAAVAGEHESNANVGSGKVRNSVSSILQAYAIINGIAAVILALVIGSDFYYDGIGIAIAATGIVASFLIYAFGEVIQLLEDIKNNTRKK